jgi:hypothetical protein
VRSAWHTGLDIRRHPGCSDTSRRTLCLVLAGCVGDPLATSVAKSVSVCSPAELQWLLNYTLLKLLGVTYRNTAFTLVQKQPMTKHVRCNENFDRLFWDRQQTWRWLLWRHHMLRFLRVI